MPLGSSNLETYHFVVHVGTVYLELIDIPVDSTSDVNLPPTILIYLQNFPLGFHQEVRCSSNPFVENPINTPFVESHKINLKNLMDNLGGGRARGNQPSPPRLNLCVMNRLSPLNIPFHVNDLSKNYLNLLPKYNGKLLMF